MDLGGSGDDDVNDICHACKGKKTNNKQYYITHGSRTIINCAQKKHHTRTQTRTYWRPERRTLFQAQVPVACEHGMETGGSARLAYTTVAAVTTTTITTTTITIQSPLSTPLTKIAATAEAAL